MWDIINEDYMKRRTPRGVRGLKSAYVNLVPPPILVAPLAGCVD